MDESELAAMEAAITDTLMDSIDAFETAMDVRLLKVQAPTEVAHAAALAAAQVLVSFHRGWKMRAAYDE